MLIYFKSYFVCMVKTWNVLTLEICSPRWILYKEWIYKTIFLFSLLTEFGNFKTYSQHLLKLVRKTLFKVRVLQWGLIIWERDWAHVWLQQGCSWDLWLRNKVGPWDCKERLGDWKAMDNNNRVGVSGWKLIKRTLRVRVDSGSTERIIAEARQGW